jgi:formyltetrahydrofolate synthetase
MDLGTVKRNLTNNIYESVESCLTDIQQVWDNCKLYNVPENVALYRFSGYTNRQTSYKR